MIPQLSKLAVAASMAAALLGTTPLAAQTADAPRSIAHAQGSTPITATPQKVAVLSIAALDTLHALKIPVAGVPARSAESTVRWPQHLIEQYTPDNGYTPIAIARGDDAAKSHLDTLQALKPDLIIVDGRTRNQYNDAKAIAPTIDLSVSNASFVDSVVQNILTLGAVFGHEAQANAKALELLAKVRTLRETGAKQGTALVLFAVGDRVMPQQPDARFGMIYEVAGIRPVLTPTDGQGLSTGRPPAAAAAPANADDPAAKAAAAAAQKARTEAEAQYLTDVMAREPDWLLVVDRHAAFGDPKAATNMAATPAIANSKAWQQKKVVFLDQDGANWYLMAGGLGLLEQNIAQLQAAFDRHQSR